MKKIIFYFLPFLFFILGYYSLSWLAYVNKVPMPSVVGLSLTEAMTQFSAAQLNVRVLGFKEEPESVPGTIVQQIPAVGSFIKPHQRVFVVVAKLPEKPCVPNFVGLSLDEAKQVAKKQGIQLKQHEISSATYSKNSVIAQSPHEGALFEQKVVHIYVCSGEETMMLFPHFSGQAVSAVQDFCAKQGLSLEITYASAWDERYGYDQCVAKQQRPFAGALVDMKKPVQVQISIEKA